jgi:hypothetical protein
MFSSVDDILLDWCRVPRARDKYPKQGLYILFLVATGGYLLNMGLYSYEHAYSGIRFLFDKKRLAYGIIIFICLFPCIQFYDRFS